MNVDCFVVQHTLSIPPNELYSDGSIFRVDARCGSAVVLPNGQAAILCPPGFPSGYKAELYAFTLASQMATPGATIFTDSKAVLTAVQGSHQRVVMGHLVQLARTNIDAKSLSCCHVRSHIGIPANEQADVCAKRASRVLPSQKCQYPRQEWDVCFEGERQHPPHKVWARHLIPHFSHEGVHWWSWAPLRKSLKWAKWFFGAKCVKCYSDPRSFWKDQPSTVPCPVCLHNHNQSIHGVLAFCRASSQPVLSAWLAAWTSVKSVVWAWRLRAQWHDLQLTGKLLCPTTLVEALVDNLGFRHARKAVSSFYTHILPSLENVLPKWTEEDKQGFKLRLDPFRPEGWDVDRRCLP